MDKIKASCFADLAYYSRNPPYRQIEYLEGTGTQYIDTGIVPSVRDSTEVDIQLTSTTIPDNPFCFIDDGSPNTNSYGLNASYYPGNMGFMCGWSTFVIRGSLNLNRHSLKVGDYEYYIDGTRVATFPNYGPTITRSLKLFGWDRSGQIIATGKLKVFRFTVTTKTNVRRMDLVPYIRTADNKPGMLDLVTNIFFTNDGTGEFIAGSNV